LKRNIHGLLEHLLLLGKHIQRRDPKLLLGEKCVFFAQKPKACYIFMCCLSIKKQMFVDLSTNICLLLFLKVLDDLS